MVREIYKGQTFVATVFRPEQPSRVYVFCYPGSGEMEGIADGSSLAKIHYGYDTTIEFPFNIVIPQTLKAGDYNFASNEIKQFVDDNADAAIFIGWSQGGKAVIDLALAYHGYTLSDKVRLIVTIDGQASGTPDFSKAAIPIMMVTGKQGKYFYPLLHQRDGLTYLNKVVKFIETPDLDHSGLMHSVYDLKGLNYLKVMSEVLAYVPLALPSIPISNIVSTTVQGNKVTFIDDKGTSHVFNLIP